MSNSRHLVLPIERRKQMSYGPCATVVSIVPPSGWIENKRLLVTVGPGSSTNSGNGLEYR